MVQVRTEQPISEDGSIDLPSWVAQIIAVAPTLDAEGLQIGRASCRERV